VRAGAGSGWHAGPGIGRHRSTNARERGFPTGGYPRHDGVGIVLSMINRVLMDCRRTGGAGPVRPGGSRIPPPRYAISTVAVSRRSREELPASTV
jgi:hypothetical protein